MRVLSPVGLGFLLRLVVFGALIFACLPAQAQNRREAVALTLAMDAVKAENWSLAAAEAGAAGRIGRDIIEWHRLRAAEGNFSDYRDFLARRPDWPGLKLLRRRGEPSLRNETPGADVIEYFRTQPPQTGAGALQLARAWRQSGKPGDADAEIVRAWRSLPMGEAAFAIFTDAFTQLLQPHHTARLDMLLWRGRAREARAMQPLVSEAWQALSAARLALRRDRNGVDALVGAVPASLANHPGLAFERFAWRARKGRNESAAELAIAQSRRAEGLGEADQWGNQRRIITRQLMRAGKSRMAYQLAATNGIGAGRHYADLEWLAGYIALRKLNDAEAAREHFARFRAAVFTPISLGRAGYWQGRAEEALGNSATAREFYSFGAGYQTSFYGLLAAERAGVAMDSGLTGREEFPAWRQAPFLTSSVLQAGLLLHKSGDLVLATRFLTHLSESLPRDQIGQLGDIAQALDEPYLSVMIGKRAAQQGLTLHKAYFPLHPLARRRLPVAPELALSIARRESEFNPLVVSPAGARGLMQLMPRTAQAVSQELGISYNLSGLTENPNYNTRLGSAYLAGLIEEFGPSYVLVAAGYNAGPSRPRRWITLFGDPRAAGTDPIDWIEHIPFRETRNYVMRVMESLVVYRARLSGRTSAINLTDELRRTR